jgi:hypothetical protein
MTVVPAFQRAAALIVAAGPLPATRCFFAGKFRFKRNSWSAKRPTRSPQNPSSRV